MSARRCVAGRAQADVSADRAAVCRPQAPNQRNAEKLDAILQTGQALVMQNAARQPFDKQLTQSPIEDKFRADTDISANSAPRQRVFAW